MDSISARQEWMTLAECTSMSLDIFYTKDQDRSKTLIARHVCSRCPVILQCRIYASERNEQYGIWGGMNSEERRSWWKKAKTTLYKTL